MTEDVSLQTVDRIVRRSKEMSKLLSDSSIEQIFKDNQELIGYSSSILNSLERMESSESRHNAQLIAAIDDSANTVKSAINEQTKDTMASIAYATGTIVSSINTQTSVISSSANTIVGALETIDLDIKDVITAMKKQTAIQKKTLEVLEEIHETLKHPLEAESNELFERGSQWMSKGFLSDSVEAFQQSIQKNPTNFLAHYYLGLIYLCGKNEDDDMIDLDKAEEELKLAIKYSRPDLEDNYVKQYAVMMHQAYSDFYYTKALLGETSEQNYENAYQELMKALSIDSSVETKKCLNSRLVKCSGKTNRCKELVQYAKFGFLHDYACLNYFMDPDLAGRRTELTTAVNDARMEIQNTINCNVTRKHLNLNTLQNTVGLLPETKDYSYLSLYEVLRTIEC